jgi:flavin reductase (DIM6/NTAB) family NADH-FMN oxidoreductase RutF
MTDGRPYGMTVSSFTSVSLEPPLILVCIDRTARFVLDLPDRLPFAVNVLNEQQQEIAVKFARSDDQDRFFGVDWEPGWEKVPHISGAVTTFDCSLRGALDGGDHMILLGEVREILRGEGSPLIWCDRAFHCLPARPRV